MTEVLPAEAAPPHTSTAEREALLGKLDDLLARYLELLDEYTKTRQQLSAQLSSGYLFLAQANFNSPSRTRYGQDYYDERMQAGRRVTVESNDDLSIFEIVNSDPSKRAPADAAGENQSLDKKANEEAEKKEDADTLPISDLSLDEDRPKQGTGSSEGDEPESGAEPVPVDPLKWFGILVPPALRNAQAQFANAVENPIPQLCGLLQRMRKLEGEIGRARKAVRKL